MICEKCNKTIPENINYCPSCVVNQSKVAMAQTNSEPQYNNTVYEQVPGISAITEAQLRLKGNVLTCVGVTVIIGLINFLAGLIPQGLLNLGVSLLINSLMALGIATFYLKIARGQEASSADLFTRADSLFKAIGITIVLVLIILVLFWVSLYTALALGEPWIILLFIPLYIFIYIPFAFSMHVLSDNPNVGAIKAMKHSATLMSGHTIKLFGLFLLFGATIYGGLILIIRLAVNSPGLLLPLAFGLGIITMLCSFILLTYIAVLYNRCLLAKGYQQ